MKHLLTILFLLLGSSQALFAQKGEQAEALFAKFKAAATFDYRYPREKVYVHFDNSGYLEGDTIWYKAYVVRASSLTPTNLSRVLYVDLLNADGQLMEQQTLRIDSLGQANGAFSLALPVRAGFYEVRAYTREMTNWDEAACFTRVLPVFGAKPNATKQVKSGDFGTEELQIPMPTPRKKPTFGSPRPYTLGQEKERRLSFYPEGGWRANGLDQEVAFWLTDGRGHAVDDTLQVFADDGQLVAQATAEHEGRGSVLLPAGMGRGHARLMGGRKQWPLPEPTGGFSLHAVRTDSGLVVQVMANDSAARATGLLGLAVMNRDRVCYFDTLSATTEGVEQMVPMRALRSGVNRIELYGADGRSRATRLVWCPVKADDQRKIRLKIRQNKAVYAPFEPAVLEMQLQDAEGRPVQTTLSVAVREESGNLVAEGDGGVEADLLLSSEVRGYIASPQVYFEKDDAVHRRMVDLLLMVQGWSATPFQLMCGADTFRVVQPIEDHLVLRGRLLKGLSKQVPQANINLNLQMYSLTGGALNGHTRTDADGRFTFQSTVDYVGNYIAQFTAQEDDGKRRWNRLMIDRWFAPDPRAFSGLELDIRLYAPKASATGSTAEDDQPETFEWEDTIPRRMPTVLGEAKVTVKNKYRGFTGTRYSWLGGDKTGMRRATIFYNVVREVERAKDTGQDPGNIWHFLNLLNQDYQHDNMMGSHAIFSPNAQASSSAKAPSPSSIGKVVGVNGGDAPSSQASFGSTEIDNASAPELTSEDDDALAVMFQGKEVRTYVNNEPLSDLMLRFPEYYQDLPADGIKNVSIVTDGLGEDAITGQQTNRSRSRYSMYVYELPDYYRTHSRKKGVERRNVQGFTPPTTFYVRDYRSFDMPTEKDMRRTLHWAPSVSTNSDGKASIIFFTNAREGQRLDISVRGVTAKGEFVE